jgi:hypothetical protein
MQADMISNPDGHDPNFDRRGHAAAKARMEEKAEAKRRKRQVRLLLSLQTSHTHAHAHVLSPTFLHLILCILVFSSFSALQGMHVDGSASGDDNDEADLVEDGDVFTGQVGGV